MPIGRRRSTGHWRATRVTVLLVGPDFLASDFIREQQLPVLLRRAEQGGTRILSLILGHCQFSRSPLGRFEAVNDPDRPLQGLRRVEQDKILNTLAGDIALELSDQATAVAPVPAVTTPQAATRTQASGDTQRQSRRASPGPDRSMQARGAWIFGGLLLFLLAVFAFAPPVLAECKQRILAFCAALLAGLFGWFLSGEIRLGIQVLKSRFGELTIRAGGGMVLFVLVLGWWLSPLAPVAGNGVGAGTDIPPIRPQILAGNIRNARTAGG